MALAHFKVNDDGITVNEQDISGDIAEWQVHAKPGEAPELWVRQALAGLEIEGNGIVKIVADDDQQSIMEFLDAIDPKQWEQDTLASLGMGDGDNVLSAALGKLKEYAGGSHR